LIALLHGCGVKVWLEPDSRYKRPLTMIVVLLLSSTDQWDLSHLKRLVNSTTIWIWCRRLARAGFPVQTTARRNFARHNRPIWNIFVVHGVSILRKLGNCVLDVRRGQSSDCDGCEAAGCRVENALGQTFLIGRKSPRLLGSLLLSPAWRRSACNRTQKSSLLVSIRCAVHRRPNI